jgi:hypothetical protein
MTYANGPQLAQLVQQHIGGGLQFPSHHQTWLLTSTVFLPVTIVGGLLMLFLLISELATYTHVVTEGITKVARAVRVSISYWWFFFLL